MNEYFVTVKTIKYEPYVSKDRNLKLTLLLTREQNMTMEPVNIHPQYSLDGIYFDQFGDRGVVPLFKCCSKVYSQLS